MDTEQAPCPPSGDAHGAVPSAGGWEGSWKPLAAGRSLASTSSCGSWDSPSASRTYVTELSEQPNSRFRELREMPVTARGQDTPRRPPALVPSLPGPGRRPCDGSVPSVALSHLGVTHPQDKCFFSVLRRTQTMLALLILGTHTFSGIPGQRARGEEAAVCSQNTAHAGRPLGPVLTTLRPQLCLTPPGRPAHSNYGNRGDSAVEKPC